MQLLYVYALMQIIFESLPVSSSGNVMLWMPVLQKFLMLEPAENLLPDFDFLLHIPTLFVIGVFFFSRWSVAIKNIRRGFGFLVPLATSCVLADAVTVLFYFLWKCVGTGFFPLWIGFLCTTVMLGSLRFLKKRNSNNMVSPRDALLIGLIQGLALLPGISRFASTLVAGRGLGYSYEASFYYSFLIQVPLIAAATLKGLWSLAHAQTYAPFDQPAFYFVVTIATVLSLCVFSFVFGMVKRKTIWLFAWYTGFLTLIAKALTR